MEMIRLFIEMSHFAAVRSLSEQLLYDSIDVSLGKQVWQAELW